MQGTTATRSTKSSSEDDLQADALALHHLMGAHGALWILDRIAELDESGDVAGIRRLRRIAAAYERLVAE